MTEWLEALRILVSLLFLAVSSWYDYKAREVSNRVWVLYAPAGFALTFLQLFLDGSLADGVPTLFWILSFALISGLSLAFFYAGFFGGADAKALICLSIALPVYPSLVHRYLVSLTPIFPLAVLINGVLGSSLLVVAISGYNALQLVRAPGRLFEGLEHEPVWSKILAFTTGFKVDSTKLAKGSHYMPLESFAHGDNGEIIRHLRISARLADEGTEEHSVSEEIANLPEKVWATPGLPFLVFVTAGFFIALLVGDLISWLLAYLSSPGGL